MTKLNQKKLLIIFSTLLFVGFLFLVPQKSYAINFTAGYYENHPVVVDNTCEPGYWRASVELKDYQGNPLTVDELNVRVIWHSTLNEGVTIYSETLNNVDSFESECEIEIKSSSDLMVLEVIADKDDCYEIKAANPSRQAGSGLNQRKWSKTLYLADFETAEANIAYLIPEDSQWISDREEHSEMKLFVNKSPRPENITEIEIEIMHSSSRQKFSVSKKTNIAEGEEIFNLPALTEQGGYTWRIVRMRGAPTIFYNENQASSFNFDSVPPEIISARGTRIIDGQKQSVGLSANFEDAPPGIGMCKIEFYINEGNGKDPVLVKTSTTTEPLIVMGAVYRGEYKEYEVSTEYKWKIIGYDCIENKTKAEGSYTVNPLKLYTHRISSTLYGNINYAVDGAKFDVINVDPVFPGSPEIGTYTTTHYFDKNDKFRITFKAHDSFKGEKFSFWGPCINNFEKEIPLSPGYGYSSDYMYFGVSKLEIFFKSVPNIGLNIETSNELRASLRSKPTKIDQIQGTPIFPDGSHYHTTLFTFFTSGSAQKTIDDVIFKFHDSDDGVLEFSGYGSVGNRFFCQPDPDNQRRCQGSIDHFCGTVTPIYRVRRGVEVESYLGADTKNPVAGVKIIGEDGFFTEAEVETPYTFSSIGNLRDFFGTFKAEEFIYDNNGNKVYFDGWAGDCESDGLDCYIDTDLWYDSVTATVKAHYSDSALPPSLQLDVEIAGTGNGTVTSDPGTINCQPTCSNDFSSGQSVELTAIADAGSEFVRWTEDCTGTNATCTVVMEDSNKSVKAEFAVITYDLIIDSTGGGSVTDPGEGDFTYDINTVVDLEAERDLGYRFVNWTGDTGTIADVNVSTTTITMNGDYTITANFAAVPLPTAEMECELLDCRGPGCVCDNTFSSDWETFSNPDVIYYINNTSPSPDITGSIWSIIDYLVPYNTCPISEPLCDLWRMPWISPRDCIVQLEVRNIHNATDTISHPIRVKRDTVADFECSLTGVDPDWHNCAGFVVEQDQVVYFKGEEGTTLSRSSWHTGLPAPAIETWQWEKGSVDGDGNFVFEASFGNSSHIASTTLTRATSTIHLTVRDNHPGGGRTAQEKYTLNIRLPLPEYREVRPRSHLDNFLARLSSIFVRL